MNGGTHSRPERWKLARPKRVCRGGVICEDLPARHTAPVPCKLELERVPHHLYRARRHTYHQAQALRLLTTRLSAAYDASEVTSNIWTHSLVNNRMAHRTQPDHAPGLSPGAGSAPARRSLRPAVQPFQPRPRGSTTKSDTAVTMSVPNHPINQALKPLVALIPGALHVCAVYCRSRFFQLYPPES